MASNNAPQRKRTETITIRVTPDEKSNILRSAKRHQMPISTYILRATSPHTVSEALAPVLRELRRTNSLLDARATQTRENDLYEALERSAVAYDDVLRIVARQGGVSI